MPRRDEAATEKAHFSSKESFVSTNGHEYLYGVVDHGNRRLAIFEKANGMCQLCPVPHFVDWEEGEWHHTRKTYGGRRCDCVGCGVWSCRRAHVSEHNRIIKWSKK
jgi:hypothetical protein